MRLRRLGGLLRAAGLGLLGTTAAAGVALAAAGLLASTGTGSRQVGGWLGGLLDGLVAGHIKLGGLWVKPGGDIEVRDIEITDPAGHTVIRVARARARFDLGQLARRSLGVELELTRPELWLEPGAAGRLTVVDAFSAPGSGAPPPSVKGPEDPWHGWKLRVVRLRLDEAAVTWRGEGDRTWLRAGGLALEGKGALGAAGSSAELALAGRLEVPLEGPLTVELTARIEGSRLTVPRLILGAAGSRLEAFGELDWRRESFRAAVSRVALAERDLTRLGGSRVVGGDLEGRLYAESDGERLSAAVDLAPPGGGRGGGRVAVASRSSGRSPRLLGFEVALAALDPSRLLSRAPRGRFTLSARGAVAWPLPAPGPFSRGHLTVDRLDLELPGLGLTGAGRWTDAGAMSGALRLEALDLALAGPAVATLLGVSLPALAGRAVAELALAGSAAAPEATMTLTTPGCSVAGVTLAEARGVARLAGAALELEASAGLGPPGGATVAVRGAALLSPDGKDGSVTRLELGLGGQSWALAAPVTVSLAGPRLGRAELRSGGQRLVVSGGLEADGAVELQADASGIDLARLPAALVPGSLGLAGIAGGSLHLAGAARRQTLVARVELEGGRLGALGGLVGTGQLDWRRETNRVRLEASLRDGEAGRLELAAELPWPVEGAPSASPVKARLALAGWQLTSLLGALRRQHPAEGLVGGELTLAGTTAEPRLAGQVRLTGGRWSTLSPLELDLTLAAPGESLRAGAELKLGADPVLRATAELPYQRRALLAHPGQVLGRLPATSWSARLELLATELATVAGKAGLPAGLSGRLSGEATLSGTPLAPRGTGSFSLSEVALVGVPPMSGPISFSLEDAATTVTAALEAGRTQALRLGAGVAAPVERLGEAEVHRRARLTVTAATTGLALPGVAGGRWTPSGRVSLTLEAAGTLAAPRATLSLEATALKLGGLPLGDLKGTVRTTEAATRLDLTLLPPDGGALHVVGSLGAAPGLSRPLARLAEATLDLTASGTNLGVGFLPALLPTHIRAASGTVQGELAVTGSPRAPRLVGRLVLAGGKLTLPGWGTFTSVGFEASFAREAVRLQALQVRRGAGRVEGELSLTGLGGAEARIGGSLQATAFGVARVGRDLATIDARAALGGRYREGRLEVEVNVEKGGTVRLPRKAPRELQPIEDRPDITIGETPPGPAGGAADGSGGGDLPAPARASALAMTIRVRGDGLLLKSDQPRVNVELRTDATWEVTASPLQVSGTLEAYLGNFEPLAGRPFKVARGAVAFPGGAVGEAQLDLAADYENPSAKVRATVSGTLKAPNLRLTSEPPLDEASLAMLIVTGRTDVTAGGAQGSAFNAQDAGMAAAMAVANKVFEEQLGQKMPLDSLTLDSSAVTAAKQLTDRILVSYIRRFDARPEKGENVNEVRVQYHMTPRWTLESRYGNAGAGGASVVWQRDY